MEKEKQKKEGIKKGNGYCSKVVRERKVKNIG